MNQRGAETNRPLARERLWNARPGRLHGLASDLQSSVTGVRRGSPVLHERHRPGALFPDAAVQKESRAVARDRILTIGRFCPQTRFEQRAQPARAERRGCRARRDRRATRRWAAPATSGRSAAARMARRARHRSRRLREGREQLDVQSAWWGGVRAGYAPRLAGGMLDHEHRDPGREHRHRRDAHDNAPQP
jgi:hypothetical protein